MVSDLLSIILYGLALLVLAFASVDGCRIVFRGVRDHLARSGGKYRFLVGTTGTAGIAFAFVSGADGVVSVVGWAAHGLRPWRTAPYQKATPSLDTETGYPKDHQGRKPQALPRQAPANL